MGRRCLRRKNMEIFLKVLHWQEPFYSLHMNPKIEHYVNWQYLSNDYSLDQYQLLKLYSIWLIAKLTFDKCTWKLDYSSGGSTEPELTYYSHGSMASWNSRIWIVWLFPQGFIVIPTHISLSENSEWDIFPEGSVGQRNEQNSQHLPLA